MTRSLRILLACAIALIVAGAGSLAAVMLFPAPPQRVITTVTGELGGPFTLTANDGRTVTDQTYRGKWLVIYFGFASCPDACPTALNNMGVALDRFGPDAAKLQPVFITVDPKRDTQKALAEYLKSFDLRIVALTGTEDQIASVVKEYRVYATTQPADADGRYMVNHSNYFYVVNPDGKFVSVVSGGVSGEELAEKLRELMRPTA